MSASNDRVTVRRRRPATNPGRAPVAVLLLHGIGAGAGTWDGLHTHLPPHLELWDAALPWAVTGDPLWHRDPEPEKWVARAVEATGQAAGRAPDVLVAHSFAANLTLGMLAEGALPEPMPTALVSPFYRGDRRDLGWLAIVPDLRRCYAMAADEIRRRRGSKLSPAALDAIVGKLLDLAGADSARRFHEAYLRTPLLDLESVTRPVLLVGGDADEFGAGAADVRGLAERLPHAVPHVLAGCGHFPMTDRAEHLAALLGDFIDRTAHPTAARPTPEVSP